MAHIIVAEDDEIVGEIVRETLTASGHAVGVLADGVEALKVIRLKNPDLVILDCNMPGLGGVLVLREMRGAGELCEIPVLMLTGRRGQQDVELAMFQGANDYMTKPFDPEELGFRVDVLLEISRARQGRRTDG